MCLTCPYSLCKNCIKDSVIFCVRENKGFCEACMKVIMLIENNEQGNKEMVCFLFLFVLLVFSPVLSVIFSLLWFLGIFRNVMASAAVFLISEISINTVMISHAESMDFQFVN